MTATEPQSRPTVTVVDEEKPKVAPTAPDADHAQVEVLPPPPEPGTQPFDLAGTVGAQEFAALAAQARLLHMSGAAPKAVREDIYLAFHLAMAARDYGLSLTAGLDLIDVIDTKKGFQLSPSPQLLNGQVERLGLGKIVPFIRTREKCVALALEPGGKVDVRCRLTWPEHHVDRDGTVDCVCAGIIGDSEFTWEDAQIAGLVQVGCQPGAHTAKCLNYQTHARERCNHGYIAWPQRMHWWRAAGFCADDWFPQASLGRYSPANLGEIIDADGRAVDPATVPVPEGYEPEPTPAEKRAAERAAEEADPVRMAELDAERHALEERAHALPEKQRHDLAERWKENDRLRDYRLANLPRELFKLVNALLSGFESAAKKDGWDQEAALAEVRAAHSPQEPSGTPTDATPAGEADRAQEPPVPPDPPESEAPAPPDPRRPAFGDPRVDWVMTVRDAIDVSRVKPVAAGPKREVNIILTGWGYNGDARFAVLEALFGRPFTSTSELTHGEAKAIIERVPHPPKKPKTEDPEPGTPDPNPDAIIERVRAMTDDEVTAALAEHHLPGSGNQRLTLAEHLAGVVKDVS